MMMPNWNKNHQIQWIEEKWDLTLRMIRYFGMHHNPVWLIEVEEDLFLISFFQLYQSTRMMMPNWNNNHQIQWIEEKWDLTLQMIWQHGMLHYPVWLIEVEEDLFLNSFIQLYQSVRMMMPNWNKNHQIQWIEEKWDLTLRMIRYFGMHHNPVWLIEVEEDLFLISFFQLYQSTRMMMPNWNNNHQIQWIEEKWDLTLQMIWQHGMLHYPVWLIEVEEDLFLTSFFLLYQSTRMMTLHSHRNHRNTHHQTRWIEGKWDLTLQMIWFSGMLHHPVWLIEVEEDLFLNPFIKQYQSTRMMMPNWNNNHQTQWIEEKWDLTLQMIWYYRMHHHLVWLIEVEEDLFLNSLNSVLPIKANELVELKQFSPISTVSSASNSVNSNDFADWNALLLILNDFNDFISTSLFQQFMVTHYYNRGSIVERIISKCYRAKRGKNCSQYQSHFPPCRANGAW